jgi:small-conductance mechanosensitive channel
MKKIISLFCLSAFLACFAFGLSGQNPAGITDSVRVDSAAPVIKGVAVSPFGTPLFDIHAGIGKYSARDRAKSTAERIRDAAEDPLFNPDSLMILEYEGMVGIGYKDWILSVITNADAEVLKKPKEVLVLERKETIAKAILDYRHDRSSAIILKDILFTLGTLIIFIIVLRLVFWIFKLINRGIGNWLARKNIRGLKIRDYELLDKHRQMQVIGFILSLLRWGLTLILFLGTLMIIFYILPWTKGFSITVLGILWSPVKLILTGILNYIPNFLIILVILILSRYVLRFFRFFKKEIEAGALSLPGFYPDWALPTYNIIRVMVIIFVVLLIWPYIPGSDSQVFKGVSVFIGIIFSLTSASTMSNFMAGFTLTYTRAFRIGDRVRIGDIMGDVIEKSMIVTKIRTIKNEEVTIPNNKIMNSETINYSTAAPDLGLILNTTVTIGYNAPWKRVHELLIAAALNTPDILHDPKPFVFQTALNDFFITYQINAYTRESNKMMDIYSNLHQQIQDSFNQAGVEIMSPHYTSARDGNTIAIPDDYIGKDYIPPAFRVRGQ